jgi:cytochrome c oxidase cbb3-type subunit II
VSGQIDEFKLVTGAMAILGIAVSALVVVPHMLLASLHAPAGLKPYTPQQLRGRDVYIKNGCVYCHSQQPRDPAHAPDLSRGWGRPSVAADYVFDRPHLLGTSRTGPDLFNIGARQPSEDWQLGHLYQPRAYTKGSIMPAFKFLFVEHVGPPPAGEKAINIPPQFVSAGITVLPTQEARDLVAYLMALDHTYPVLPATGPSP